MKKMLKKALLGLALAGAAITSANAGFNPTSTYPGLAWGFSTGQAGFSQCGTLFLDATGDAANSDYFVVAGRLSCAGGSYATVGSAYFDAANNFNLTISLSVTHNLVCSNLSGATFSGACQIYDNQGNLTSIATINIL